MYILQDKETGTFIDSFETLKEAEKELKAYEKEDTEDENYTEDFYEIKEATNE